MQGALELFASKGFYSTTIPDIAISVKMSVGNMYNYFKSKDILAEEIIKFISAYLGKELQRINEKDISTKEKTRAIVAIYFEVAMTKPEMIDYFLRIYLSNREIFRDNCAGMICVNEFVTEVMIYFEEGVKEWGAQRPILAMTGRVTMLGISKWNDAISYKTIERFFDKKLNWLSMNY